MTRTSDEIVEVRNILQPSRCASSNSNTWIRVKDVTKFSIENRLSMGTAGVQARSRCGGSSAYLIVFGSYLRFYFAGHIWTKNASVHGRLSASTRSK